MWRLSSRAEFDEESDPEGQAPSQEEHTSIDPDREDSPSDVDVENEDVVLSDADSSSGDDREIVSDTEGE